MIKGLPGLFLVPVPFSLLFNHLDIHIKFLLYVTINRILLYIILEKNPPKVFLKKKMTPVGIEPWR